MQIIGFAVFEFVLVAIIVMLTVARLVKAQGANVCLLYTSPSPRD